MTSKVFPWGNKVSPAFRAKVILLCKNLGWTDNHAIWLMGCMAFESGETFSSSVKNAAGSGAIGLIQFMPATAKGMGVTTVCLSRITPEEQLDYVEQYFKPYARKISSLNDMYMAILLHIVVTCPGGMALIPIGCWFRK